MANGKHSYPIASYRKNNPVRESGNGAIPDSSGRVDKSKLLGMRAKSVVEIAHSTEKTGTKFWRMRGVMESRFDFFHLGQ